MFGVLTRAKAVKKRTLSLARLNVELAKLEGKQKATAIGTGAGLGAGAAVLIVYGIGFAFAALAAGLSEAISLWLSLLIVAGILFLAAAIAAFLAVRFVQKGVAADARAGTRGGRPDAGDVRGPCLRSPILRRSGKRSPPSGSVSMTISTRCKPSSARSCRWPPPVSQLWRS